MTHMPTRHGLALLALLVSGVGANASDFPRLRGPYLGQKPPGLIPEVFAPEIVSTDQEEGCSVFAGDGRSYIFRRMGAGPRDILITELRNGHWTEPRTAPFASDHYDGDFTIAPDGRTILFTSKRPLDGSGSPTKENNIWTTTFDGSTWSQPRVPDPPVTTAERESYPTVAKNGTLYFFSKRDSGVGKHDIYRCRRLDGRYTTRELLPFPVNSEHEDFDPYVAPDGSYLIVCSQRPGGLGAGDLWVAFRANDDSWSTPVNMGASINSSASENRPCVTPDGKYLFFTSNKRGSRDIYWINARIIEKLRPSTEKTRGNGTGVASSEKAYLAETPPGPTAVVFAPGIISTDAHEYSVTISKDLSTILFTRHVGANSFVYITTISDGHWTAPRVAPFSGQYSDYDQSFAPDGTTLYFASDRPRSGTPYIGDIWFVRRTADGWTDPRSVGEPINTDRNEACPSITKHGTLYFHAAYAGGPGATDIYRSLYTDGAYSQPVELGETVNSRYRESNAFVSPDEDFIIFGSDRPGGLGRGDLYISFRRSSGEWLPGLNMGDSINTVGNEYCPSLSADGQFLFFTRVPGQQSEKGDIYWLDARVIHELKGKATE